MITNIIRTWQGRLVTTAAVASIAGAVAVAAVAGAGNSNGPGLTINPNWPAAKQQKMQQILDRQAAARARHVPKPSNGAPSNAEAIPARVGGLITGLEQSPFSPTEFLSNSTWSGVVDGLWVQIYAGADETGPAPVGELRGISMPVNPNDNPTESDPLGTFMPPSAESGLSLTDVHGDVLTVTAPSGDTYSFDVATKTWTKQ